MAISKNSGTPKSSILIGFSTINHPFSGTPILETPISYRGIDSSWLMNHGWSTKPPLTYPPQKEGFNKALLRETNG